MLIDFVPDKEPYEHLTVVELTPAGEGVSVVMTVGPLHDEVWTERLVAGRADELDNLAAVIGSASPKGARPPHGPHRWAAVCAAPPTPGASAPT